MQAFKIIIAIVFTGLFFQSYAQEKQSPSVKYTLLLEGGFCGGIKHVAIEQTVFNGITINGQHVIGFGMGLGSGIAGIIESNTRVVYCPIYANYRYYFKTGTFSPHLNFAVGGMMLLDSEAWYSSLTAGFRKHKFTFSSGIFFHAYQYTKYTEVYHNDIYHYSSYMEGKVVQEFPVGLIVKVGVTF
ncbi:MAG: hypothetical protein LBG80_08450 [Bacteroidales bacterium]|jgi:hypothetical protein|nr:hypothetical protein [Bacteroidales bacterium]